jgi:D-alanine-D-alanine ligase
MSFDKATTTVGVLMGGLASERGVSLKSGKAVLAALQERGWNAVPIDVGRDLAAQLVGIDVAWLALHGRYGEDGCVQGLLELMAIPYTGSGVRASAVAMDKIATKRALASVDVIDLVPDAVVRAGDPRPASLPLPVIVKPAVGGSTLGMAIVREESEWAEAIGSAAAHHPEVLVERLVPGEEITCAVLDGEALPVVRIEPQSGFFDFEAKYTDGSTRYEVPATIPSEVAERAQRAAVAAHAWLGCRGLTRSDFILEDTEDGIVPRMLEINTLPGMTATSLSPMAASCTGMDFGTLVEVLLQAARLDAPPTDHRSASKDA